MSAEETFKSNALLKKLSNLTKRQLIDILANVVHKIPATELIVVSAVENFILQSKTDSTAVTSVGSENHNKKPPQFEISKYRQRHIALQIQYDGTKYCGFASQESDTGIENLLFSALTKVNLIGDPKNCNYSRCGRTDRGVSALGQVVALHLRSAIPFSISDDELPSHPGDMVTITVEEKKKLQSTNGAQWETVLTTKDIRELDYCAIINRCLPSDVRVIGWSPVTTDFSARFSASYRKYRYFFIKNELDIDAMNIAASYLVGSHDFRNICKLDVANVTNFVREIFAAKVVCFEHCEQAPERSVWMLEIQGIAFLWHMVRCIMALLFLVGEGKEKPEIISDLLSLDEYPAKPSYAMAEDYPLVLHECGFEHLRIYHVPRNLWHLAAHFKLMMEKHTIAAAQARNALEFIRSREVRKGDVLSLMEELIAQRDKSMKKLQNKLNQKEKSLDLTTTSKRKFMEISQDFCSLNQFDLIRSTNTECISWGYAMELVQSKTQLKPTSDAAAFHIHIPLKLRNREHAYADRIQNLSGLKKDRYERHINLSEEAAISSHEKTNEFFERMRLEGSILI